MHRNAANALFLSLLASCLALAQTAAPTQRIRGDVVSVDGLSLQVKERSGEMLTIKLAENYVVTGVAKIGIEAITPNAFVGVASMPQSDGTQSALEVLVSGSRLNALAGHGAPLRIEKGRARRPHASQSREVNVWLEFERTVRELVA